MGTYFTFLILALFESSPTQASEVSKGVVRPDANRHYDHDQ